MGPSNLSDKEKLLMYQELLYRLTGDTDKGQAAHESIGSIEKFAILVLALQEDRDKGDYQYLIGSTALGTYSDPVRMII